MPCGRCRMCKVARAREWATRCLHELGEHPAASFVTLTYDDEHLPDDLSISKRELQLFFKRLRKDLAPEKIRYLACGEYGEHTSRPHYHAVIFGVSVDQHETNLLKPGRVEGGFKILSGPLKEAWSLGFVSAGTVTYDSVRYLMDYLHKQYNNGFDRKVYGNRQRPFQLQSQSTR